MIDLKQFEGHTPGPWFIGRDCSGMTHGIFTDKRRPSTGLQCLAQVYEVMTATAQNERDQNQRLMAASPELLDELARLRAELEKAQDLLVGIKQHIGMAEWGTDERGAAMYREFIDRYYIELVRALSPAATKEDENE